MTAVKIRELSFLVMNPKPNDRIAMRGLLRDIGVTQFEECSDPQQLPKERFDFVLICGQWTEKELPPLVEELRVNPATQSCPIVLHTTITDRKLLEKLGIIGLNGILRDPLSSRVLEKNINSALKAHKGKELARLIRQASFFGEFTSDELKSLLKVAHPKFWHAGDTIINKGDPAKSFFVLLKGTVEVMFFRDDGTTASVPIHPGSPFGELAILDDSPRAAFCLAADEVCALEIGSDLISDVTSELRLKLFARLALILADRIRNMGELIRGVGIESRELPEEAPVPEPKVSSPDNVAQATAGNEIETQAQRPGEGETVQEVTAPEVTEGEHPSLEGEDVPENPYCVPTGVADSYNEDILGQEEYDVLRRKINLRMDFILAKIPPALIDMVANKLYGYWTGGKLAKVNPHRLWKEKSFTQGSTRLMRALHLVVVCEKGCELYNTAFLGLPLSHRVVGLSQTGCYGTFLGSESMIDRYLNDESLEHAIQLDFDMAIDRLWMGKEVIEFLTHTSEDVRDETLFLIVDKQDGRYTRKFREKFPLHQIVTVVEGSSFDLEDASTFFTQPEEDLMEKGALHRKNAYKGEGFYTGETFFMPDLSFRYQKIGALAEAGFLFAALGLMAQFGPDYSGIVWGSRGGAEGAVRAARAMFGVRGAQTAEDLASAINWADE